MIIERKVFLLSDRINHLVLQSISEKGKVEYYLSVSRDLSYLLDETYITEENLRKILKEYHLS